MPNSAFNAAMLVRKLDSVSRLSDDERAALGSLQGQVVTLRPGQDIVREGDSPARSCLILEGYACTYGMTGNGRRQIMSLHVPGDIPDLQSLLLDVLDSSLMTITPCKVALIPHTSLRAVCAAYPGITMGFWRQTLVDAAVFRAWIRSIGRREGVSRIAHLFCELMVRMKVVGLADGRSCAFPYTQALIADCLGLTPVHVNRILQELRAANLVELVKGQLTVLDWDGLVEKGDFDPTFLHLEMGVQAA